MLCPSEPSVQNPDIGAYVQRGRQAMMERRFDDAREIYQQILALDPAQPRAWLALSALAQSQGDFRESVRAVRSAVPAWKRSGSQQFITELSMRLLVLGEYKDARDIIALSDWSDPVVLRYSMGLVQYLGLTDAHQEALALADHALSRIGNPPSSLLLARANALRHLGRMQEATEAFERCIASDPMNAEAHWALAHHQRSARPGDRVTRIRRAIAHTKPGLEDAIYLQYALFKELDDADRTEEAWQALQVGASAKRQGIRYADSAYEENYHALMHACNEAFFLDARRDEPRYLPQQGPIFVVGLPRSGTTLLERMLGNHPDVMLAGELNDFPMQMAWESGRFIGEIVDKQGLQNYLEMDFRALGAGYQERTSWRLEEKKLLVDKLPNNVINAAFIHRALPDAKIICLRRGAMDSCFSTFKHLFSGTSYPYSYDLTEMANHYRRFIHLTEHWQRLMPNAFLCVDYEALVTSPEEALSRVAAFCGLSTHVGMEDVKKNLTPSATASSSQVREGIHTRNLESWKRYEGQLGRLVASFEARD
nr:MULTISPECIES: tetratricopeptide repeat-containing sulfotransferase family protein [unclassified Pseudoxanthomonas]